MREECRDLVPALHGLGSLQVEGLGDGLTRHRELQGEAPGVQRCLRAWRTALRWTSLSIVRMREESGDGRGDERGMQERLQGAGPLGINLIQPVHRLV